MKFKQFILQTESKNMLVPQVKSVYGGLDLKKSGVKPGSGNVKTMGNHRKQIKFLTRVSSPANPLKTLGKSRTVGQ